MTRNFLLIMSIILLAHSPLFSQFYYVEDCKNSTGIFTPKEDAPGYTSGKIDAEGDGWLRLTNGIKDKKGYVLAKDSYPSNLGLTIEFDFKVWHSSSVLADGFSVFLFDGSITDNKFQIGYSGRALGYLPDLGKPGLSGCYLGVGIDEYGFHRNYLFNRNDGSLSRYVHAISVGGSERSGYKYIASTLERFLGTPLAGTTISHDKSASTRPNDNVYYRRLRVQVDPAPTGVNVSVFLKTENTENFVTILQKVHVDEVPFPTLRVGFAATTGGLLANHEVRNVMIKTSGDLAVYKRADIVNCIKENDEFTIETIVSSGILTATKDIRLQDTLPANFTVLSRNISGGTFNPSLEEETSLPDGRTVYSYSVDVPEVGTAIISWSGYFSSLTAPAKLQTSVSITPPDGFIDSDLADNYFRFAAPLRVAYKGENTKTICDNELPYTWNGLTFTEAGTKTTKLSTTTGCDSIIDWTLKVHPTHFFSDTAKVCISDLPYIWREKSYTNSGIYSDNYLTTEGCDSIYQLNLNIERIPQVLLLMRDTTEVNIGDAVMLLGNASTGATLSWDTLNFTPSNPREEGLFKCIATASNGICSSSKEVYIKVGKTSTPTIAMSDIIEYFDVEQFKLPNLSTSGNLPVSYEVPANQGLEIVGNEVKILSTTNLIASAYHNGNEQYIPVNSTFNIQILPSRQTINVRDTSIIYGRGNYILPFVASKDSIVKYQAPSNNIISLSGKRNEIVTAQNIGNVEIHAHLDVPNYHPVDT
ncbi:MAG: hypothetical protein ACRCSB_00695, partial [Bacteroidales bacterium]